jgi:hypothetical protein
MIELILFAALVLAGFLLIARGAFHFWRLSNPKNWTRINVSIQKAEVVAIERPEVYANVEYFLPKAMYSYKVDDVAYENDTVSRDKSGWITNDKKELDALLKDLVDKSRGYCNPRNPTESVLTLEVSKKRKSHYFAEIIGGIMVLMSCIVLLFVNSSLT